MAGKVVLACVAVLGAAAVSAMQVTVPLTTEECFLETVEANSKFSGSFEVLSGGLVDVDCTVYHPRGTPMWGRLRQRTGSFEFIAPETGEYKVCFSNAGSSRAPKVVAFSLHLGDAILRDIALKKDVTPLELEIERLASGMQMIQDEQKYYWARERAARDTNESTNTRVLLFSLAEMGLLIAVAAIQVYVLVSNFGLTAVLGNLGWRGADK